MEPAFHSVTEPVYQRRTSADWKVAHTDLERFARSRAGEDFREGQLLLRARRAGVHARLGYGSWEQYVERLLGYGIRLAREKFRVAEALEHLPALANALATGALTWSAVRELTRVASPGTETLWIQAAMGRTAREVERMVSGRPFGSLPFDPADENMQRHVLRFEVTAETLALFREAMARVRQDAGAALDDDESLLLMARRVLGGSNDGEAAENHSSYQIAINVCDKCKRADQVGKGEPIPVSPEVLEMSECDAQYIGPVATTHVGPGVRATRSIPPALRRAVLRRDHGRCVVPGCSHATFVDVHHVRWRSERGQHVPENLATLCGAHHRAIHLGRLFMEGTSPTEWVFRHADGTLYGQKTSLT